MNVWLGNADALKINLPPGTSGYSVVSSWTPNGMCTRTVETETFAGGQKPETISHETGSYKARHGSRLPPRNLQPDKSKGASDELRDGLAHLSPTIVDCCF